MQKAIQWFNSWDKGHWLALIAIVVTILIAYFPLNQSSEPSTQVTNNNSGGITITNTGSGDLNVVNNYGWSTEQILDLVSRLSNIEPQYRKTFIVNFLPQISLDGKTINDLQAEVEKANDRVKELLGDESISAEIKQLVLEGRLKEAEELVDKRYAETDSKVETKLAQRAYERGTVKELNLKYSEAKESFVKAAILQPVNSDYQNAAGLISAELAEYDNAIAYYEAALASDLKTFGGGHPSVAIRHNNLGIAWSDKGDYDKAIRYYELSLKVLTSVLGDEHPNTKLVERNLERVKALKKKQD